jgi:peptidoglycan/LPS O-acetylase OafA/YrhL
MTIRLIRLFPLYLFALLLALVVFRRQLVQGDITLLKNIIFALCFLPSLASPVLLFPLNAPAWSLFYELLANASFGLIGRHLKTSLLLLIVSIAGAVLLIAVYVGWLGFGSARLGAMADGFQWEGVGAGAARVAFSFFVGILVFRARKIWQLRINIPPLVVVVALTAILVANPPERYQATFDLIATLFVFPGLIFFGASSAPTGVLAYLFSWIGTASYAIYVLQAPVYELVYQAVSRLSGGNLTELPWTWGAAFVVIIFSVAIIADKYVDRPVRRMLSTLFLNRVVAKESPGRLSI